MRNNSRGNNPPPPGVKVIYLKLGKRRIPLFVVLPDRLLRLCPLCLLDFKSKKTWLRHMRKYHPDFFEELRNTFYGQPQPAQQIQYRQPETPQPAQETPRPPFPPPWYIMGRRREKQD